MKKNATIMAGLFQYLFIGVAIYNIGCKKNDNKDVNQKSFAVQALKASSGINLSGRNNWQFFLGNREYTFQINDSVITATPKEKPYNFVYSVDNNGSILPVSKQNGPLVNLFSANYYYPTTCGECPPKPNIKDQSTEEKLQQADLLYGVFSGTPSTSLDGIRLIHQNALLDFDVQNIPAGSIVIRLAAEPITPFYEGADHYKAIVLPSSTVNAFIYMQTTDSTYRQEIKNTAGQKGIAPNTHYTFTARFDPVKKEIFVENLSEKKWSEE